MRLKSTNEISFRDFYFLNGNAPKWFVILTSLFLTAVKVGILYAIAKGYSIEAALIVYVIFFGILSGIDDHSDHRNMNMLAWNDQQLNERISSLEETIRRGKL